MPYHTYGLGPGNDESFVTAETEPDLPESRVITAGPGVSLTDTGTAMIITSTGGGGGAGSNVKYVVMAADPSVVNARIITPGPFIQITDNTSTVVISATGVPSDSSSFLTTDIEASLVNSRRLTNGSGIAFTDDGTNFIVSADSSVTKNTAVQTLTNKKLVAPLIDYQIVAISGDYTAADNDNVIFVDASAGPVTVSFSSTLDMTNQQVMVKKIDTSANIVTISSADLIDGNSSQTLEQPYESYTIISTGTTWYIL